MFQISIQSQKALLDLRSVWGGAVPHGLAPVPAAVLGFSHGHTAPLPGRAASAFAWVPKATLEMGLGCGPTFCLHGLGTNPAAVSLFRMHWTHGHVRFAIGVGRYRFA